jgi:hypothetical protein
MSKNQSTVAMIIIGIVGLWFIPPMLSILIGIGFFIYATVEADAKRQFIGKDIGLDFLLIGVIVAVLNAVF